MTIINDRSTAGYIAAVEKIGGRALINVVDSSGLLGLHSESTNDYTIGMSATLIVSTKCRIEIAGCSCRNTCESCKNTFACKWDKTYCRDKRRLEYVTNLNLIENSICPCQRCLEWYNTEVQNIVWLHRVNKEFKCPCKVKLLSDGVQEIDNPSNKAWKIDTGCTRHGLPYCSTYHSGADGCLRSVASTVDGSG